LPSPSPVSKKKGKGKEKLKNKKARLETEYITDNESYYSSCKYYIIYHILQIIFIFILNFIDLENS